MLSSINVLAGRMKCRSLVQIDNRDFCGFDVERSKVNRCCFHPGAGGDCPRYCGFRRPSEQLTRAGQRADPTGVPLVGLGMSPARPLNALGIDFDFGPRAIVGC